MMVRLRRLLPLAALAMAARPPVAAAQTPPAQSGATGSQAALARDLLMANLPSDYDRRMCARVASIMDPGVRAQVAAMRPPPPAADAATLVGAMLAELDAICRDTIEQKRKAATAFLTATVPPAGLAALDSFRRTPGGTAFLNGTRAGYEIIYFGDLGDEAAAKAAVEGAIQSAVAGLSAEDRETLSHALESDELMTALASTRVALERNGFLMPNEELTAADEARLEAAMRRAIRARQGAVAR